MQRLGGLHHRYCWRGGRGFPRDFARAVVSRERRVCDPYPQDAASWTLSAAVAQRFPGFDAMSFLLSDHAFRVEFHEMTETMGV